MQLPPHGVYAVRIIEGKRMFAGAANIGMRPTVEQRASEPTVEVHIFDFSENLVGKELSIEFVQFLRGEQKFSTLASLTAQIERDCKQASEINSYPSRA
jgi:riboflavin kinase/FMN adenylyltransferase